MAATIRSERSRLEDLRPANRFHRLRQVIAADYRRFCRDEFGPGAVEKQVDIGIRRAAKRYGTAARELRDGFDRRACKGGIELETESIYHHAVHRRNHKKRMASCQRMNAVVTGGVTGHLTI